MEYEASDRLPRAGRRQCLCGASQATSGPSAADEDGVQREPKARQFSATAAGQGSPSFRWDVRESLGMLVLGAFSFYLLQRLIDCYERLLRAYAAGYAPPDER
jgi:hypothetical protein